MFDSWATHGTQDTQETLWKCHPNSLGPHPWAPGGEGAPGVGPQ